MGFLFLSWTSVKHRHQNHLLVIIKSYLTFVDKKYFNYCIQATLKKCLEQFFIISIIRFKMYSPRLITNIYLAAGEMLQESSNDSPSRLKVWLS